MTQEEASRHLHNSWYIENGHLCVYESAIDLFLEAVRMGIKALRPVSREQVEEAWRGEWMGSADGYADGELVYDTWECSHCGYVIDEEDDPDMLPQFCPKCYAAMTDKAVEMVMERMEALRGDR